MAVREQASSIRSGAGKSRPRTGRSRTAGRRSRHRAFPARDRRSAVSAALLVLSLGLIAALFWDSARNLVAVWSVDPNYSHGFFVPLLSLWFAWRAWRRFGTPVRRDVTSRETVAGLAEVILGMLLHAFAWFYGILLIDVLALICVLRGVLLAVGGSKANRAYGFAALFLVFMSPLPMRWYQPIAVAMQQIVSAISAEMLDLFGTTVFREGNVLHLTNYSMEVGEACSGLRQLTAMLALAVAMGHLSGRGSAFRWTLGLLALPVAVAANSLRVVLTGFIAQLFGAKWAEGVYHTLEGMAVILLAAAILVAVAALLARIEDRLAAARRPEGTSHAS